jgi:hypothetical protein
LRDFLGGGAVLVDEGVRVEESDLIQRQKFTNGTPGIRADQFRRTNHIVTAQDFLGTVYVLLARDKTGSEIREELWRAGASWVIKWDGGSGLWADSVPGVGLQEVAGTNWTGLMIR